MSNYAKSESMPVIYNNALLTGDLVEELLVELFEFLTASWFSCDVSGDN